MAAGARLELRKARHSKWLFRVVLAITLVGWLGTLAIALQLPEDDLSSKRWEVGLDLFGTAAAVAALIIAVLALERYNEEDYLQAEQSVEALVDAIYEPYLQWAKLTLAITDAGPAADLELRNRAAAALDDLLTSPAVASYWTWNDEYPDGRSAEHPWSGSATRITLREIRSLLAGDPDAAEEDGSDPVDRALGIPPRRGADMLTAIRRSWPDAQQLKPFLEHTTSLSSFPDADECLRGLDHMTMSADEALGPEH